MCKYLIAHDLGTSGDKATLFCEDGTLIHSVTKAYPIYYGEKGAVEQNPEEWWQVVCETTQELLTKVDPHSVAAVSFSGQMMGCTCMDREGRLLRNSIIWADTRSVAQEKIIEERYGREKFFHTTGFRLNPSYSITKLMWVKEHEPEIYHNTYKTLCCKDYIVYRLTGVFVTDHTDASLTLAYDINKRGWAYDVMEAAGVDPEKFPAIEKSAAVVGEVTREASAQCGLPMGTPVVLGSGDGGAGRVGTGVVKPGRSYSSLGTSAWVSVCTEQPVFDAKERVVNVVNADPEYVTVSGTMQACGASINWMRENLCQEEIAMARETGISKYEYINANAAKSPVGANGLLFLPYLHGERAPHWNAHARGCFIGLTMKHTANDMKRAVMEGVALNMGLIFQAIRENDIAIAGTPKVIGGCIKSPIVKQALADIYNIDLALTNLPDEATSMGAAILAGCGVGLYPHQDMCERFSRVVETVYPIQENVRKYREILPVFQEAYESLRGVFEKLA